MFLNNNNLGGSNLNNVIDTSNNNYTNPNKDAENKNSPKIQSERRDTEKDSGKKMGTPRDSADLAKTNPNLHSFADSSDGKDKNNSAVMETPSVANQSQISQRTKEKMLFKLKDEQKIIIFYISKQSFKEKYLLRIYVN